MRAGSSPISLPWVAQSGPPLPTVQLAHLHPPRSCVPPDHRPSAGVSKGPPIIGGCVPQLSFIFRPAPHSVRCALAASQHQRKHPLIPRSTHSAANPAFLRPMHVFARTCASRYAPLCRAFTPVSEITPCCPALPLYALAVCPSYTHPWAACKFCALTQFMSLE